MNSSSSATNPNTIGEYTTSGTTINPALISDPNGPFSIAVSGEKLFVDNGSTIGEYTTSGATINPALISGLNNSEGIAVSGSKIFVTNSYPGSIGEYTTSGATVNASLVSGLVEPYGIAVSGSNLFVGFGDIVGFGHPHVAEFTASGATVNGTLIKEVGANGVPSLLLFRGNLYVLFLSGGETGASDQLGTIGEYTSSGSTVNPSLVTDFGDPLGIAVSNTLATASVSGTVYNDLSGDGIKDRRDNGLADITIAFQRFKHQKPAGRAQTTTTNAEGEYSFKNLAAGVSYKVSEIAPRGYTLTEPSSGDYKINLSAGQSLTGENFGNHQHTRKSDAVHFSDQPIITAEQTDIGVSSVLGGQGAGADGDLKSAWSLE